MSKVVLIGVSLAVGLGMGTLLDRSLLSTPHNSAAVEASADGMIPSAPLQGTVAATGTAVTFDIEPMRAMLREELAAAMVKAQGASTARPVAAEVAAPAASPQQQRDALQAAEALVVSGHWGDDERINFHKKLALLTPEQREQAMQQLMQAYNSGALKVSTSGPMF